MDGPLCQRLLILRRLLSSRCNTCTQACSKHDVVVKLPKACQLTYGSGSDPALLSLIDKVPLWGARLALQVLHESLLLRSERCNRMSQRPY